MFHALYGTPVVILRVFMVYGPGQRRASFHTRSMGASWGLHGGRNSKVSTRRYLRVSGASETAWW
jgi:nucleoside-diphosphate-sugar epimerase